MSEIDFKSSAQQGDIVEIGIEVVKFGNASLTLKCEVRNKMTRKTIIIVDKIIMVSLDQDGNSKPHGKTKVEFVKDRLNDDEY
jgi:acyl-CoA hydrolase